MGSPSSRRGAAVLGSPISHSLSPVLHTAAYAALGRRDWAYRAIECTEADLSATLTALDREGLAGVSLTMPLKRAVMPMLRGADNTAEVVDAANTVVFGAGPGEWFGANTDVPGLVAALDEAGRGPRAGEPWVLGAGATARSALAALARIGYRSATVVARRVKMLDELASSTAPLGITVNPRRWTDTAAIGAAELVISTTPAGASDEIAAGLQTTRGLLLDVVYSPWPTPLGQAWVAAGGQLIGGLELLVEQAAIQVKLMTGETPPVAVMREAGYAALGRSA